jgi:hypothetical protein
MITDLFVATSGIEPETLTGVIPPACRREISTRGVVTTANGELVLELPEWCPRVPSRHLVPSVSMLTSAPYAVRFELSAWTAGTWSPWVATATIGPGAFAGLPDAAGPLACDTDVYMATAPVERLRLRVRVGGADGRALADTPWMATLSACDLGPLASETTTATVPRLSVPAVTQLEAPPEIALRICSPTSVAMVLAYWDAPVSTVSLAQDIFHRETDRYGVWPAAIRTAGRHGVAGYLLRFPDWASAAWCLERKLPIVASVRYAAGELTGAPLAETSGHLIVLTGCEGTHVSVNDPVAPTADEVPRRYRRDEIERAWLARTGVGYVLFRP